MARPPVDRPTGRKVTLYMLPDVEQKARDLGGGNLSAGVALAVKAAKARKAKRKADQQTVRR